MKKINDNNKEKLELIDGQQRLTTIYLIKKYLDNSFDGFSLEYETRECSQVFLREIIDKEKREKNKNTYIDYYFMTQAYKTIAKWFINDDENKKNNFSKDDFARFLDEKVKVIWYEIKDDDKAKTNTKDIFARLNIGKIPLTNAELVKALFLSSYDKENEELKEAKQNEIALQWDLMEQELQNEEFWYFLCSDEDSKKYQTRMDLMLDLIAGTNSIKDDKNTYATFYYFNNKKGDLKQCWEEIYQAFLTLKGWFDDNDFYHKIGYLIASEGFKHKDKKYEKKNLKKFFEISQGKTKTEFKQELDECIKNSIGVDFNNLSYKDEATGKENETDKKVIFNILLLFNVESTHKAKQRFAFNQFKEGNKWTLEHIHAQNSEGLTTKEQWGTWIGANNEFLQSLNFDILPEDIKNKKNEDEILNIKTKMTDFLKKYKNQNTENLGSEFTTISNDFIGIMQQLGFEETHTLDNLALLEQGDNSSLSNSIFDTKRKKIIDKDKKGEYIPLCTKNVFLKYYSEEATQLYFWGENDRENYLETITKTLKNYMEEK